MDKKIMVTVLMAIIALSAVVGVADARERIFQDVIHITEEGQSYRWTCSNCRKVYVAKAAAEHGSGKPVRVVIRRNNQHGDVLHDFVVHAGEDRTVKNNLGNVFVVITAKPYAGAYVHIEKH